MSRATRNDVAKRAGTSAAVVSYVVNNGPRPVAPATRERVERAIAELGYRPNLVARALRSTRSNTIGLVVPDSSEPFFTELTHAVERAAFERGSLVLLGNSGFSPEREHSYVESLASMRVDGILLVHSEVGSSSRRGIEAALPDVPLVYLNHRAPKGVPATSVVLDNRLGGRLAAEHLLEHGYRRIGCVTGTARSGPVAERARGCLRALAAAGLSDPPVLRTELDRHTAREQVKEWLAGPDRPDAVFASGDGLASDTLNAAHQLGLEIPTDLAVVGFGGTEAAAHQWPALTSVGHPFQDFGETAVATLTQVQQEGTRPDDVTLAVELVRRRSCGCQH